jgi:tetratricopeptide (TPR) repeat protein
MPNRALLEKVREKSIIRPIINTNQSMTSNEGGDTGILGSIWKWAIGLHFLFRKWIYHRRLGPFLGPIILVLLGILYLYLFIATFYLFIVKWGIPPVPITFLALLFKYYGGIKLFLIKQGLYVFLGILLFSYIIHLFRLFRFPRNHSKKICIGIAFSLDFINSKDISDILSRRKEVVRELRKILEEKDLTKDFKIKILNDFQANSIHRNIKFGSEFNTKLLRKTKMAFIIYGYAKKSSYASKSQYKYELNYIVSHRPLPWLQSLRLSKEFTRILKKQNWLFPESSAGEMVEVVAENIRQDAIFAIGASAMVAQQPRIGRQFLDELLAIPKLQPGFRIRINEYQSMGLYFMSAEYLQKNNINEAIRSLEEAIKIKNNSYDYYMNMSYLRFLNNEIDEALKATEQARIYSQNSAWRFNKAFLFLYKDTPEDIQEAIDIYRSLKKAMLSKIPDIAYSQILTTLEDMVRNENHQFLYGLIFIYAKVLNDKEEASSYFQLLGNQFNNTRYQFLVDDAKKLVS